MNLINDEQIKVKREKLYELFKGFSINFLSDYEFIKSTITKWEYSIGESKDIIPYERLIPSVVKEGKALVKLTKKNVKSKNLISYGINDNGKIVISQKKFSEDIDKYGENIRFIKLMNDNKFIFNAHIYQSKPEQSRLLSICHLYEVNDFIYYIAITPPRDWFVRVDKIIDGRIERSSLFATSWFQQMDYEFIYNEESVLSEILIGNIKHWSSNK